MTFDLKPEEWKCPDGWNETRPLGAFPRQQPHDGKGLWLSVERGGETSGAALGRVSSASSWSLGAVAKALVCNLRNGGAPSTCKWELTRTSFWKIIITAPVGVSGQGTRRSHTGPLGRADSGQWEAWWPNSRGRKTTRKKRCAGHFRPGRTEAWGTGQYWGWIQAVRPVLFRSNLILQKIFSGGGQSNPLQYSCLGNPTDGESHRVRHNWSVLARHKAI